MCKLSVRTVCKSKYINEYVYICLCDIVCMVCVYRMYTKFGCGCT
jgi:hypothetical protein